MTQELNASFKLSLQEYRLFLEMQLGRSKNTVLSYLGDIKQFAEFLQERKVEDFSDVAAADISEWISIISSEIKSSSQSRKLSAMKSLAGFLVEEKIWRTDYSELVARPKIQRPIPEVLTRDELLRLLEEPKDGIFEEVRDKAMLELMYTSGLRVSELCSIKISDFDFDTRIVRVLGKGDKVRLVPVGNRAIDAITKYLRFSKDIGGKCVHLFFSRRQKKLSRKTFWYNIKKYAARAAIDKEVKPHMLRHSFATHLLSAGANLMAIKEMLGHSDLATTQIYTKIADGAIIAEHKAHHPRSKMKVKFKED